MKLNNLQKNLYIFFSVIISILIVSLVWEKINFPLNNKIGAKGLLVTKGYNPLNDTIRYFFFISGPLIIYLFTNYFFKKKVLDVKKLLFEKNEKVTNFYPNLIILSLLFIFFIFLEFFSLNLFDNKLDHFHDGTFLAPAQNYLFTKNFWTSSYLTHGGSDIFYPILSWKIFGIQSIGAGRSFTIFLTLLLKILCIFLAYQLTKISNLSEKNKILFFSFFAFILISLSHYNIKSYGYYFSHRDIYIVLFLIFFIQLFIQSNFKNLILILISILATISIFFHIDTGFYINFILLLYFLYLITIKKYKDVLLIIFSLFFSWSVAIGLLGNDEILAFWNNTKSIIVSMDLMHGIEYPEPFFSIGQNPDGTRATRGLLLQITAGIFVLNYLISDKKNITRSKKIFFLFLLLLSFLMYKNALSRSDAGHIRMSNDIPILINSFFILNYLLIFLEKNLFIIKSLSKRNILFVSIIFLIFFNTLNRDSYNIENIRNFKINFINYIELKDENFLDKNTIELIKFYKKFSNEDGCVANISYDDAISYLLKKPSCTKYWSSWLASPTENQKDYILRIKKRSPTYILYKHDVDAKFEGLRIYERIKLINSYILSEYTQYKEFDGYYVLKKR